MTPDDFGIMAAMIGGSLAVAAFFGWRGGQARADVALLGGSGVGLGALAALLFAL